MDTTKVPTTTKALARLVRAVRNSRTIEALDGLGEAGQADEITFAVEGAEASLELKRQRGKERTARSRARRAEIVRKLDGNGDADYGSSSLATDGISTWNAETGADVRDEPGGDLAHLGAGASVEAYRG